MVGICMGLVLLCKAFLIFSLFTIHWNYYSKTMVDLINSIVIFTKYLMKLLISSQWSLSPLWNSIRNASASQRYTKDVMLPKPQNEETRRCCRQSSLLLNIAFAVLCTCKNEKQLYSSTPQKKQFRFYIIIILSLCAIQFVRATLRTHPICESYRAFVFSSAFRVASIAYMLMHIEQSTGQRDSHLYKIEIPLTIALPQSYSEPYFR